MLHTNISEVRASTTPFPGSLRESEPAAPWPKHCPLCSCGQQSVVGHNAFAPSKTTFVFILVMPKAVAKLRKRFSKKKTLNRTLVSPLQGFKSWWNM